jgi:hypothetical protein
MRLSGILAPAQVPAPPHRDSGLAVAIGCRALELVPAEKQLSIVPGRLTF